MKILVVDDDPAIRFFMSAMLLRQKHFVSVAGNGLDGVETAIREQPDLIFMDLMMPMMDGEEAAKWLKEDARTAHIPIVAVSAKRLSAEAEPYFDRYLEKPVSVLAIQDFIAKYRPAMAVAS